MADQQLRRYLDDSLKREPEYSWDYAPQEDSATAYIRRGRSTQGTKASLRWPHVAPGDP